MYQVYHNRLAITMTPQRAVYVLRWFIEQGVLWWSKNKTSYHLLCKTWGNVQHDGWSSSIFKPMLGQTSGLFQYEDHIFTCKDSHYKDKIVVRPAYLYDLGITNKNNTATSLNIDKPTYLYWISPLNPSSNKSCFYQTILYKPNEKQLWFP